LDTVHARDNQPTTNDQRRHDTAYLNKRLFYYSKVRRLKITADLISSVAFVDNNKPLFETKLAFATCYNEVPNNTLPRMIALYRLACRPSVQPNITGLHRFSTGVRELLSARLSARFITMLCNLIHINRNSKRSHTLTEDLLKRDIYLQIRPLPITLGEPTTSCTRPGDATHSAVPSHVLSRWSAVS